MLAYILANTDKSLSTQINVDVEYTLLSRGSGVRIPPGSPLRMQSLQGFIAFVVTFLLSRNSAIAYADSINLRNRLRN